VANLVTRDLEAGYDNDPGQPPPFHTDDMVMDEDEDYSHSRLTGQDDTLITDGWVGYSDQPGADGAAYRGRDLADQSTWGARPYNEVPGMLTRLHQEAGNPPGETGPQLAETRGRGRKKGLRRRLAGG
jgi:hypothetical protein